MAVRVTGVVVQAMVALVTMVVASVLLAYPPWLTSSEWVCQIS